MPVLTRLLKGLDAWLGPAIVRILPRSRGRLPGAPRRIGIIRPGGIGDAVLLAPALACLQARFPAARITVLAERRNAAVFDLAPQVATTWCYDRPAGMTRFCRQQYDILIDSEQSHYLSAVLARAVRARVRIGFATNARQQLFDLCIPYSHGDHETTSFLRLLTPLGISPRRPPAPPFLTLPRPAVARAERLLAPVGHRRFACIFPGASIRERRWGADRFHQVARSLVAQGIGITVVGGQADRRQGERIVRNIAPALNLAGSTSLLETAAVLARAALLVSGDSGILHLAVGLGIPTVSLFGPGIAEKWAPQGGRHVVINKGLPCSPCTRFGSTPPCPRNTACLAAITPAEVANAAVRLLEG